MESVIGRPFRSGWDCNPILPEDHRWPPREADRPLRRNGKRADGRLR